MIQCDSLLNKLVKDGVLHKGYWNKHHRVGFQTLLIMCDVHMKSALVQGCLSWDTHISKQLSIVLVAALASRSGDISRTRLYTGMECLAFKDITLRFTNAGEIEGVTMDVELRFVKGFK